MYLTQICKILLWFWSYVFWTRNNLWPLSGNHISKISSILPGPDPNKIPFTEGTLSVFMCFYHSASQKCIDSRAPHVHNVPEIPLLVTISSLGSFSYSYFFWRNYWSVWKQDLYLSRDFQIKLSCSIWCFMMMIYEKYHKVTGLSLFYWNTG